MHTQGKHDRRRAPGPRGIKTRVILAVSQCFFSVVTVFLFRFFGTGHTWFGAYLYLWCDWCRCHIGDLLQKTDATHLWWGHKHCFVESCISAHKYMFTLYNSNWSINKWSHFFVICWITNVLWYASTVLHSMQIVMSSHLITVN